MTDTEVLVELARSSHRGAPFLLAYGLTWSACAVLWRVLPPRGAGLATLLQGMVALPLALAAAGATGALAAREQDAALAQLGLLLSLSQLLALPLLVVLSARGSHTLVPVVFSLAGAVHFVPFAWLYQTWLYLALPLVLGVGLAALLVADGPAGDGEAVTRRGAGRACGLTGAALLVTGVLALALPHP